MRAGVIVAALAGLGLAVYLLLHAGLGQVLAAVATVGWGGFGLLCLCGAALLAILGCAWFILIPGGTKPEFSTFVWGRAVRDSAGELLPFSQVAGMIVGARAVMLRRISATLAFASTVVDVTVELLAQIVFVAMGLAILLLRTPRSPSSMMLADGLVIALLVAAGGAALVLVLQRGRVDIVGRLASHLLPRAAAQASAVRHAIAQIHSEPRRLGLSFVVHLLGWTGTASWSWIAIHLMGGRTGFLAVFAIEAILCAVRSAAFVVPNAIGVQEGAYAMLGPLFGLPLPMGLALSLLKRARDIVLGVPVLLSWQVAEGGHAMRAGRSSEDRLSDEQWHG